MSTKMKPSQEGLQNPKPLTQSGTYLELPKSAERVGPQTGPLNTNKGKSAGVPVLEKHSLKSPFFTKKVSKGHG